jgi:peptide chain release factor 2
MGSTGFWDNQEQAQKTIRKTNNLKQSICKIVQFQQELDDLKTLCELVMDCPGDDIEEYLEEITQTISKLEKELDELEIQSFLNSPHDKCNAIMTLHAGAGGTESCDWTEILLRMYRRWAERHDFEVEIQDILAGEQAGISSVTLSIKGLYCYGYAKAERGVHRLVRISPFDSNAKRHTSFCAVDVIAEVEDDIDIQIKPEELRIDTYRSSGKGGQHVNKTDSAVRITHLPTGIVTACQNDRSQTKNKATAMKVLKSRLYERMQEEKHAEMKQFYGEKNEISWGNQIRSYVLQPYQLISDLRTNIKQGNIQKVLDGDIDLFIHAWLRKQSPST